MVSRAIILALCSLFVADVTPKGDLNVERLGNSFEAIGEDADRGLKVGVWRNVTLKREEKWHLTSEGEWFLRVRSDLYVLATHEPKEGGWLTNPLERLVWKEADSRWRRVTIARRTP